jgi:hypothetical protein
MFPHEFLRFLRSFRSSQEQNKERRVMTFEFRCTRRNRMKRKKAAPGQLVPKPVLSKPGGDERDHRRQYDAHHRHTD